MAEQKKAKVKRPTAEKRDIQHEKRRLLNRSFKSRIRTAMSSFEKVVSEKKEQEAQAQLKTLYSLLDKAVKRGIYKVNKASRLKSQFAAKL